jgi:hypothetical protein
VKAWKPTIEALRDWNILTLVSSYSIEGYRIYDCVHDEPILTNYFATKTILPYTLNPKRLLNDGGAMTYAKAAYYLVFQGENHERDHPTWTDQELLQETREAFLQHLITCFIEIENQPMSGKACQEFLEDFRQGLIKLPENMSLSQLEYTAIQYRRKVLKKVTTTTSSSTKN